MQLTAGHRRPDDEDEAHLVDRAALLPVGFLQHQAERGRLQAARVLCDICGDGTSHELHGTTTVNAVVQKRVIPSVAYMRPLENPAIDSVAGIVYAGLWHHVAWTYSYLQVILPGLQRIGGAVWWGCKWQ